MQRPRFRRFGGVAGLSVYDAAPEFNSGTVGGIGCVLIYQ
jgi:hypothetical protein